MPGRILRGVCALSLLCCSFTLAAEPNCSEYSEFGLDEVLWNGSRSTILGDAHMREVDEKRTGAAIAESLTQLAEE